jgi:hypothetical protein
LLAGLFELHGAQKFERVLAVPPLFSVGATHAAGLLDNLVEFSYSRLRFRFAHAVYFSQWLTP